MHLSRFDFLYVCAYELKKELKIVDACITNSIKTRLIHFFFQLNTSTTYTNLLV